jgi:hypothetical protein
MRKYVKVNFSPLLTSPPPWRSTSNWKLPGNGLSHIPTAEPGYIGEQN